MRAKLIGCLIMCSLAACALIDSTAEADATPTPDLSRFIHIVDGWTCVPDGQGHMVFKGEVRNTSEVDGFRGVSLRATVYETSTSGVVNSAAMYIDSKAIKPKSSSTFNISIDDPHGKGDKCDLEVDGGEPE